MIRRLPAVTLAIVSSILVAGLAQVGGASVASADGYTFTPGTPSLDTIANGTTAAPWNLSQGDSASSSYASQAPGTLLPSYTPGGATAGGEPNLAVYPGASSGTDGNSPYPSGTVGTPGPLDGYCGSGSQATESGGSPARQPAGTSLPLAPAYFPHVVQNGDGSLTGYFDYRPKDADEAIIVARSTDNAQSWTYEGEALEENPGYCPSADVNDDGQGHPIVLTIGGTTRLYTLQRPAGDNPGVGMLVHTLAAPTSSDPLSGVPASEKVGIDPDAFATSGTPVPFTGGTPATISVSQTGAAGSPEQLVAGGLVDLTQNPTPTASTIINCSGVGATTLTGCTTTQSGGITVNSGDLIEQVIGYAKAGATFNAGPNTTTGDGGLASLTLATSSSLATSGFTNTTTGTLFNTNAPNRAYVNGVAVYCNQANANPTTKIEDCTTGADNPQLVVSAGAPITSDPIFPSSASVTSGLVSPDGIVGVLPSYPGAPSGSTVVMYTEKELSYYIAGTTTNGSAATFSSSIAFTPSAYTSQDLPAVISGSSPVTVQIGDSTAGTIVPVTCTGLTVGATDTLTGCSGFTAGDKYSSTSWIGAPGATTVPAATLALTGEGSTSTAKLFKNNEDLTVLRVAYTTDGVDFSSAGLAGGGIISGNGTEGSNYDDINNPASTISPAEHGRRHRDAIRRFRGIHHHQPGRELRPLPLRGVGGRRRQRRLQPDLLLVVDGRAALVRPGVGDQHRLHLLGVDRPGQRPCEQPGPAARDLGVLLGPGLRAERVAEPRRLVDDGLRRVPDAQTHRQCRHGARDGLDQVHDRCHRPRPVPQHPDRDPQCPAQRRGGAGGTLRPAPPGDRPGRRRRGRLPAPAPGKNRGGLSGTQAGRPTGYEPVLGPRSSAA